MSLQAPHTGGGLTYLKMSEGSFYLTTDKEKENPFESLTGTITKLEYRMDTFQDAQVEKLYVFVHSDKTYTFNLGLKSSAYTNFVGFLKNADLSKPLTISLAKEVYDNGKVGSKIFVEQGGKSMKSYFRKDGGFELPKVDVVTLPSGKTVKDGGLRENKVKEYVNAMNATLTQPTLVEQPQQGGSDLPF